MRVDWDVAVAQSFVAGRAYVAAQNSGQHFLVQAALGFGADLCHRPLVSAENGITYEHDPDTLALSRTRY